jgi:hypothetical protein
MNDMNVEFIGFGPFSLPTVQSGSAHVSGEIVEMIVYVLVPSTGDSPVPIRVPMTLGVAQALSRSLQEAAIEAEAKKLLEG